MPTKLRLLLVAVGLILALWPFGIMAKLVTVWSLLGSGTRALTGETAVDIAEDAKRSLLQSNLERALRDYRATTGEDPTDLEALVEAGLLQHADLRDEWNRPLVVRQESAQLVVRSAGRDGQAGTVDDWTLRGSRDPGSRRPSPAASLP